MSHLTHSVGRGLRLPLTLNPPPLALTCPLPPRPDSGGGGGGAGGPLRVNLTLSEDAANRPAPPAAPQHTTLKYPVLNPRYGHLHHSRVLPVCSGALRPSPYEGQPLGALPPCWLPACASPTQLAAAAVGRPGATCVQSACAPSISGPRQQRSHTLGQARPPPHAPPPAPPLAPPLAMSYGKPLPALGGPRLAALPAVDSPFAGPVPLWPTPSTQKPLLRRGRVADGADGSGSLVMTPHRASGRGGRSRPSAFTTTEQDDPLDAALVQLNTKRRLPRQASVRPHNTLVKMQLSSRDGVGRRG